MRFSIASVVCALLAVALIAGCSTSGNFSLFPNGPHNGPGPTPSPIIGATFYAANAGSVLVPPAAPQITRFAVPLSAGSVGLPAVSTGLSNPLGIAVDPTDPTRLYVSNNGSGGPNGNVQIYAKPTGPNTPLLGTIAGFTNPVSINFDTQGNLYVPDSGKIWVVNHPASSSTPTTLISGLATPTCIALDAASNLYVADVGAHKLYAYAPPYTSRTSTSVGLNASSGVYTCAAQPGTNSIFVGNVNPGGSIVGYTTPLTNNEMPAIVLPIGSGSAPVGLAFDSTGSLYASIGTLGVGGAAGTSNVSVYVAPLGSTTPAFTFQNGGYVASQMAFGP